VEINLGSNNMRNTNGVIKLQGREQLVLEHNPTQIFLTMDLYDDAGTHLAHLRRNTWAFNRRERFVLQTSSPAVTSFSESPWLKILERQNGAIVLEVNMDANGRLNVFNGQFHTRKGDLVEITPHVCRIGTSVSLFGDVRECRGGSVIIG
jgi:hypothetical protein